MATGCEEEEKLDLYSETSAINANVDATANTIPIAAKSRMIAVTFFTTPIHTGIAKRYRAIRITSAIGLKVFKNLPQQRQFIANSVPEFDLLLMSQFSENALTCVCQNLPKTRLKFRSQVCLVVKFFEDLCDFCSCSGGRVSSLSSHRTFPKQSASQELWPVRRERQSLSL